jgi:pSer/pThr/pTyr-binding forkhead associated (FHA) protein
MPFCTECGNQNPDDARFCSQCGRRLATPSGGDAGAGAPAPDAPGETTATITFGAPAKEAEHREERSLNDADAAAVDALPPGSALLVVQRGPSAGSRFLLDTDVVSAGRHPDSEIFLDDVTVSRRHAEFRRGSDGYTVADVGSLNGTYVNRDRIDEVALQGGDEVQIGKYRLVYFASHAGAGSSQ